MNKINLDPQNIAERYYQSVLNNNRSWVSLWWFPFFVALMLYSTDGYNRFVLSMFAVFVFIQMIEMRIASQIHNRNIQEIWELRKRIIDLEEKIKIPTRS